MDNLFKKIHSDIPLLKKYDRYGLIVTLLIALAIIPTIYAVGVRTVFKTKASPPTGFNLTFSSPNCHSVRFDWTESYGAHHYIPFLWDSVTGQWLPQGPDQPSTARSYTWAGLPEKHRYGGQVQSFNADGTGYTNTLYVTTQSCSPPGAFSLTNFSAPSCTSVRYDWNESPWAEFYTPYLTPGGQGPDVSKSTRSYTWYGLQENMFYKGFVWGRNAAGDTGTDERNVTTPYCYPVSADIKAGGSNGPITIDYNTSATISWTSVNATSCSVSSTPWTGISNTGISTGNLTSSRTYTLTCTRSSQTKTDSVTVNVLPKPTVSISTNPSSIKSGETSTISWSSANATSVTITPDIGTVGTSGSRQVRPTSSITYKAQANAPGGSSDPAYASITVNGKPPPPPPPGGKKPPTTSGGGILETLQVQVSVPYLIGKMKIPVRVGSLNKEIEISPDKKEYQVDIKEANIAIGNSLTLVVGGNKTLLKKINSKAEAGSVIVAVGDLILGDITSDNKIDDKDGLALLTSVTSQTSKGDLNADKVANSLDWAILLANFGKSGDF